MKEVQLQTYHTYPLFDPDPVLLGHAFITRVYLQHVHYELLVELALQSALRRRIARGGCHFIFIKFFVIYSI